MKKTTTLLLLLFISATYIVAQNIVSTDPENKKVILEEYTGIYCGYCPQGHEIAQGIQDSHPDDVILVNIHVGPFAVPSGSAPDFRTQWGSAIAGLAGASSYPSGSVNRHIFSGNNTAMSRGAWTGAANQIFPQPSYLNVGLEATIVTSTRQLVVEVEVYYTGSSPAATNMLNVAILQDNIAGPQSGGNAGNNYQHMHMLRHLLTGQWGVEITETTEGTLFTHTIAYELPSDYNGVDVVLEDLDIVAFVSETHEEVISGNSAGDITFIESNDYDAAVTTALIPQTGCVDELIAEVSLKNYGLVTLTSLDFIYSVNGAEEVTYSWTGNLAQNESEVITLPAYDYVPTDANNFNLRSNEPNGVQDELPQNDSYKQMFLGSQTYPENCTFMILVMQNPESVTWSIVDEMGNAITEGGPYANTAFHIHEFSFPETGCYELIVNDATGTGLDGGLYVIGNEDNDILWTGGDFTYTTSAQLAHGITVDIGEALTSNDISIHPNPITNSANIEFSLSDNTNINIAVFDILGKKVMDIHEGQLSSGSHNIKMNSNDMQQGIYFVKLQMDNEIVTKKILVTK